MSINKILEGAYSDSKNIKTTEEIKSFRNKFLGKNSLLMLELKNLKNLPLEEKKEYGSIINNAKKSLEKLIDSLKSQVQQEQILKFLDANRIDLTIPGKDYKIGTIHSISKSIQDLINIFMQYGFTVKTGSNIENEWHNFSALNIPKHHPARKMHDTFYLKDSMREDFEHSKVSLLRTHTSPIQIREMRKSKPPHRFVCVGRTYRADSDKTHTPMFHQVEGLMIDRGLNMGHLKHLMLDFIKKFFKNQNIQTRLRPSFFPFTEPSCEIDIRLRGQEKWLEILGCGMVHPNVLSNVGIDKRQYRGFAFGLGIERITMIRNNIRDLRDFFTGDLRWLQYYNCSPFKL